MNLKIVSYKIVDEISVERLELAVEYYLKKGFIKLGSPVFYEGLWFQTLIFRD